MRAFVYKNLHHHCWSVKALEGEHKNKVIGHASSIELADCRMKVSQAGRARVCHDKVKNVHAGIVGKVIAVQWTTERYSPMPEVDQTPVDSIDNMIAVTYNPYEYSTFINREDLSPVHECKRALLNDALYVEL